MPPAPPRRGVGSWWLAALLFSLTFLTATTVGGLWAIASAPADALSAEWGNDGGGLAILLDPAIVRGVWTSPWLLSWGLRFACSLLFVLLCHELGHWFACRHHQLPATPPYFLPAPVGVGTFGAFIRIRAPIRRKRQLLEVGVAGPIAGFAALVPILWLGLSSPEAAPLVLPTDGPSTITVLRFGHNLLFHLMEAIVRPGATGSVAVTSSPYLLAAWVGMFATMLNLLPLAQLDGGHVLYAATGRLHRRIAWPLWVVLALLGFLWQGWWFWCVVVLVLGLRHPRVGDEAARLAPRDRWLVAAAVILFCLCFMPVPIRIEDLAIS